MRREFAQVMANELATNPNSALLLGDIGVFAHRESFANYPGRVLNIGILEQSMVSFAAGLAIEGITPTIHTIAPFLVERAFEQIKIDFGYQNLAGNLVSVGGSLDYSALGATHHCPGDVAMLLNIPNLEIYVPGTAKEFSNLFFSAGRNDKVSYFRLSENSNSLSIDLEFQKGFRIKQGNLLTVIAVGPMLDLVRKATLDMDVSVLYYNSISPFDEGLLRANLDSGKLFVVEPFYENTLSVVLQPIFFDRFVMVRSKGIPRKFITNYGKTEEHYAALGLTPEAIRANIQELIDA